MMRAVMKGMKAQKDTFAIKSLLNGLPFLEME
jgi:hypothetical protein